MALFDWLRSLMKPRRTVAPEAILSRQLADSITEKAHVLQENLKVYHRAKDPFAAMLADLYTRDQVSRIYKNGSGL